MHCEHFFIFFFINSWTNIEVRISRKSTLSCERGSEWQTLIAELVWGKYLKTKVVEVFLKF